ncbi:NAD(P)-dependent oxidoreductase [Chelativorans salis]|uniref:NAD(P)-binding domain-containing protein n=1 Tax=Chelativorans salis TaxID=2978478 RepID=A0ABT2LVE0_9HYPH|nr:NAD(P)-dependent oxidoreductase [Chelativorans sp. EGI FJ00035]MCT7378501.1 NAD(P)-binding domain-containing protein [Chelativorans sp. EGI FJ00035]
MADGRPVEGVYLSGALDLEALFGRYFAAHSDRVRLRRPEEIERPEEVCFALTWLPTADAFRPYPNLKLAASIAAGVDSIVHCPSLPADAIVTRVRDENQGDLMAGFAAWQVVWHHRNMRFHINHQMRGEWARRNVDDYIPPRDCTVGLLGYGFMGKAIARVVTAMGFPVVAAVRTAPPEQANGVTFEAGEDAILKTAARSRILINVLPLTHATRGILNALLFSAMPKGAALVQLGRGEHLVDEDLNRALDSGQLAGASLDVFSREPLPPDHPWWRDPRILVTPHQASDCSPVLVAAQVCRAALDVVAGRRPETAVHRANGY